MDQKIKCKEIFFTRFHLQSLFELPLSRCFICFFRNLTKSFQKNSKGKIKQELNTPMLYLQSLASNAKQILDALCASIDAGILYIVPHEVIIT